MKLLNMNMIETLLLIFFVMVEHITQHRNGRAGHFKKKNRGFKLKPPFQLVKPSQSKLCSKFIFLLTVKHFLSTKGVFSLRGYAAFSKHQLFAFFSSNIS